MKELFKLFMERAIHDEEMEKAQELAKGFPVDIALPQAMGFLAGYNAALAELEKPGEALEAVEKWADEYYGHSVLVGDIHRSLAVAFTAFAASYHAKKCAENARVPPKCALCGDPIIVGVCENCAPEIIGNE